MINLIKELRKIITNIYEESYYIAASDTTPFPYAVYSLPNSFTNGKQEIHVLDVDVWDKTDDMTEIEAISSNLWRGLDMYKHIDENIQFSIYQSNRLNVEDDNKEIKHKKLIFELRYFDRRVNK